MRHILFFLQGDLVIFEKAEKLFVRGGERRRGDGGCAVRQMCARSAENIIGLTIHKIVVAAAVGMKIHKARTEEHSLAVQRLQRSQRLGNRLLADFGDHTVPNEQIT